jgi:hypothetical protein
MLLSVAPPARVTFKRSIESHVGLFSYGKRFFMLLGELPAQNDYIRKRGWLAEKNMR